MKAPTGKLAFAYRTIAALEVERDTLRADVERLRQSLRSVIVAAGGSAAPDVSAEFLELAPLEVLALRGNLDHLQARLRSIEQVAACGSVQSWLSLPDEDKAKWFGLHVEQDFERLKFRSDALALRELVAECAEYLNFSELTSIAHGSILHRKMIDAMEAPR